MIWVDKAETQSWQKLHSQHGMATLIGRNLTSRVLPPKERGVVTPSSTPTPEICIKETSPKTCGLEGQWG